MQEKRVTGRASQQYRIVVVVCGAVPFIVVAHYMVQQQFSVVGICWVLGSDFVSNLTAIAGFWRNPILHSPTASKSNVRSICS